MKITLCGSIGFYEEMKAAQARLEKLGHEVKIPELALEVPVQFGGGKDVYLGKFIEDNGGIDAFPAKHEIWGLKEGAIKDHYQKIDWADAILVINHEKRGIKGYVGGNTLIEIGIAFYSKKPIYILNPVSSELSYKQEIMGMRPWFLDGDVEKIPIRDGNLLWFKRKTYGWGWTPCTWQGWAVTIVYAGLLLLLSLTIDDTSSVREVMFTFILPVVLLTISLFRIAYKKGEKPRWQWGR